MRAENERIDALRAVIGRAVADLLRSGQEPHRENIVAMLQVVGAASGSEYVKALCLRARELIISRSLTEEQTSSVSLTSVMTG